MSHKPLSLWRTHTLSKNQHQGWIEAIMDNNKSNKNSQCRKWLRNSLPRIYQEIFKWFFYIFRQVFDYLTRLSPTQLTAVRRHRGKPCANVQMMMIKPKSIAHYYHWSVIVLAVTFFFRLTLQTKHVPRLRLRLVWIYVGQWNQQEFKGNENLRNFLSI